MKKYIALIGAVLILSGCTSANLRGRMVDAAPWNSFSGVGSISFMKSCLVQKAKSLPRNGQYWSWTGRAFVNPNGDVEATIQTIVGEKPGMIFSIRKMTGDTLHVEVRVNGGAEGTHPDMISRAFTLFSECGRL